MMIRSYANELKRVYPLIDAHRSGVYVPMTSFNDHHRNPERPFWYGGNLHYLPVNWMVIP